MASPLHPIMASLMPSSSSPLQHQNTSRLPSLQLGSSSPFVPTPSSLSFLSQKRAGSVNYYMNTTWAPSDQSKGYHQQQQLDGRVQMQSVWATINSHGVGLIKGGSGGGEEEEQEEESRQEDSKKAAQDLDLVPMNGAAAAEGISTDVAAMAVASEASRVAMVQSLPKPLTIADFSPAPMHGSTLRVAYQGVPGAYSEAAAGKAYPNCEPVPCDQFEAAFQAVELWIADRAVLPVENSLGGSIHRNYDLLLRHRLHIVGEVQLPVHHCLLAMPGVSTSQLKRVISHPQALAQCEHTLTRLGLDVAREAVDDTAGAAQFIAEHRLYDTAAIASSRAAEIYGMNILAEGIQDDSGNVTRFVMLAREPIIPRVDRPFKTSIVFANEEATGSLFKVLSAFAFRNINLTKIESRPQRKKPLRIVDDTNNGKAKYFEYLFYIDFEASMADPRAQNALNELQEFTSFLRVLGSYPMDMTPLVRSPPL